MQVFMKNEFLLAVLMGLLVLLFVRNGSSSSEQQDFFNTPTQQQGQQNESIRYIKVFLTTVIIVYVILYLLSTFSEARPATTQLFGGSAAGAMPAMSSYGTAMTSEIANNDGTSKLLNDSIETLMKNIDINDPSF